METENLELSRMLEFSKTCKGGSYLELKERNKYPYKDVSGFWGVFEVGGASIGFFKSKKNFSSLVGGITKLTG